MRWTFLFALLLIAGGAGYIRLAPSDPAVWHLDPLVTLAGQPPLAEGQITKVPQGAAVSLLSSEPAQDLLTRLEAIVLADPQSQRLAGSAQEGRITWVSRSKVWGFPDYTTAQTTTDQGQTRLTLHARQRFGRDDFGVNAARLRAWLGALALTAAAARPAP